MNKQQLANKIWESANKMRSKIEANEYKVLFNTKSLVIEIAYLTFSKGIALLCQYQMTFKAFVILFCLQRCTKGT